MKLNPMAVKQRSEETKATAEDGVVKLGRFKTLVYVHTSEPGEDEMGQGLHFKTCKALGW